MRGSADDVAFDDGDLRAEAGRVGGRLVTRRAPTDDENAHAHDDDPTSHRPCTILGAASACAGAALWRTPQGMAGYSQTPLARKLGVWEGLRFGVVSEPGAPAPSTSALQLPEPVPHDGVLFDVLLAFVVSRAGLEAGIGSWSDDIDVDGGLWISWPKKAARKVVPSDMTEDIVRAVALPMGLVDVKVCAIDDIWSGLRLCWRTELRAGLRTSRRR